MDLSAATLSILLEAEQLDLGGTWMSLMPLEDRMEKVSEILSLPSTMVPFRARPVGYPLDDPPAEKRFDPSRVHYVSKRRTGFRPSSGLYRVKRRSFCLSEDSRAGIDPADKKGSPKAPVFRILTVRGSVPGFEREAAREEEERHRERDEERGIESHMLRDRAEKRRDKEKRPVAKR